MTPASASLGVGGATNGRLKARCPAGQCLCRGTPSAVSPPLLRAGHLMRELGPRMPTPWATTAARSAECFALRRCRWRRLQHWSADRNQRPLIEARPISRHPSITRTRRACISLVIENDGVAEPTPLVFLRCRAATEFEPEAGGRTGVEAVHAHCPAAEHFGLLPESFYQPVIQSAVDIDGEQSDELADRWELRSCNLHVPLKRDGPTSAPISQVQTTTLLWAHDCVRSGTACDTRWARSQEAAESSAQYMNSLMP
jgi:hypothetical protein